MKLGFWSSEKGVSGASSNALAIANVLSSEKYLKTVIVQLDMNAFEEIVKVRKHKCNEAELLINHIYQKATDEDYCKNNEDEYKIIYDNCISLWCHRLFYFPCSFVGNENVLIDMLDQILRLLEKYFDCVIVDIPSGKNPLSIRALSLADKVIINIPQSKKSLNHILKDTFLQQEKSYFLIGKYDMNSMNSCKNLRRLYPEIRKYILGYIFYNTEFWDRCDNNSITEFFTENNRENMEVEDSNFSFIDSISNIGQLLYKLCGFTKNKKL